VQSISVTIQRAQSALMYASAEEPQSKPTESARGANANKKTLSSYRKDTT
jgi:hypothetical protein